MDVRQAADKAVDPTYHGEYILYSFLVATTGVDADSVRLSGPVPSLFLHP